MLYHNTLHYEAIIPVLLSLVTMTCRSVLHPIVSYAFSARPGSHVRRYRTRNVWYRPRPAWHSSCFPLQNAKLTMHYARLPVPNCTVSLPMISYCIWHATCFVFCRNQNKNKIAGKIAQHNFNCEV